MSHKNDITVKQKQETNVMKLRILNRDQITKNLKQQKENNKKKYLALKMPLKDLRKITRVISNNRRLRKYLMLALQMQTERKDTDY